MRFKELILNQTEEAILISWRLQQWYEGMVLDQRAMQDVAEAISIIKELVKENVKNQKHSW
jgi:hypothetical protein